MDTQDTKQTINVAENKGSAARVREKVNLQSSEMRRESEGVGDAGWRDEQEEYNSK